MTLPKLCLSFTDLSLHLSITFPTSVYIPPLLQYLSCPRLQAPSQSAFWRYFVPVSVDRTFWCHEEGRTEVVDDCLARIWKIKTSFWIFLVLLLINKILHKEWSRQNDSQLNRLPTDLKNMKKSVVTDTIEFPFLTRSATEYKYIFLNCLGLADFSMLQ